MSATREALTVLVMAGGTGGHVYPALAVARRMHELGHRVEWLGTARGLEAGVVPSAGFTLHVIPVEGLRGRGLLRWLAAPLMLARAVLHARRVLHALRPDLVLGMGGFAAGPGGIAAWLARRPLVVHEQNAVPGLTNRLLARLADVVLEAFPASFPPARSAKQTGNPVRAEIAGLPDVEQRIGARAGPLHLLVLGGSQGAAALNRVLPDALAELTGQAAPRVRHQVGRKHWEAARAAYARAGVEADLVPFIEDMAEAYGWADLVVCRAGAMTVAELAVAGVGAILVPYPYAVDDHQTRNARYLSDAGAALLLPESELDASTLARLLRELSGARERLVAMARSARALAVPDADLRVVRHCLEALRV